MLDTILQQLAQFTLLDGLLVAAAALGVIASTVLAFQAEISKVMLRIQKDTADGEWSNEEKAQLAIDTFYERIPLKLAFLRALPRPWVEGIIRAAVTFICAQAKKLKEAIENRKKLILINKGGETS